MYIVEGGVYTDTTFTKLEPNTAERHGPFPTLDAAYKAWNTFTRWKLDICCHRLFIRMI